MTSGSPGRGGHSRREPTVITDARTATSEELAGRVKRYAITMGFRTACFISMVFVTGAPRWILFACAVFLPYVAVLLANQAHQRGRDNVVPTAEPGHSAQLTTGPPEPEVISADVVGEESEHDRRHRDDPAA
jgi:hypothetical protein